MIKLYKGDCLEVMKDIPDGSVDMILCDLPFGTTQNSWDSVIPFEPLWVHYKRVIKKNGAIVLFASQPFTTKLISSNMEMFKYCWVWEKTKKTGHMQAKNAPLKIHEDILVFSYSNIAATSKNKMNYFPQGVIECDADVKHSMGKSFGNRKQLIYKQNITGYPSSILKIKSESSTVHPTQKPVAIMEYLIKTYTNEGKTVLDNTMGSGTTGVACKLQNRNFIGIEQDEKYFEIAQKRINETHNLMNV